MNNEIQRNNNFDNIQIFYCKIPYHIYILKFHTLFTYNFMEYEIKTSADQILGQR